jgi:aspartyl-tRNA(Asn)/glutamyl-tRNA(Gln) amidotransferase subunit C
LVTVKDVEYSAKLARLALSDEKKEKYARQFSDILGYFDQLREVDTSEVEPMAHVMPVSNVMKEDETRQEHTRDDILRNAPLEEDGYFRVPKI